MQQRPCRSTAASKEKNDEDDEKEQKQEDNNLRQTLRRRKRRRLRRRRMRRRKRRRRRYRRRSQEKEDKPGRGRGGMYMTAKLVSAQEVTKPVTLPAQTSAVYKFDLAPRRHNTCSSRLSSRTRHDLFQPLHYSAARFPSKSRLSGRAAFQPSGRAAEPLFNSAARPLVTAAAVYHFLLQRRRRSVRSNAAFRQLNSPNGQAALISAARSLASDTPRSQSPTTTHSPHPLQRF